MIQEIKTLWKQKQLSFPQKIIRIPLAFIPKNTKVRVKSGVNKGLLWITGSNIHGCWIGNYESKKQKQIKSSIKNGMVVWDIGANVGFYTLAFSKLAGSLGKVFSFEPLGRNAGYLIEHINLNSLHNVVVFQAALSDKPGVVSFTMNSHSSTGKITSATSYKIPCLSVDHCIENLGAEAPDLMKIDVEGAEAYVLKGAYKLLEKNKPEIWLALHGENAMADCTAILHNHGYKIYDLDGNLLEQINTDEIVAKS